jgi:hypothetical protein
MTNAEYKTIIARKPVVTKIEQYRRQRGLPSKSQALAAMTEEVERKEQILAVMQALLVRIHDLIVDIEKAGDKSSQKLMSGLADLVRLLIEQISAQLVQP